MKKSFLAISTTIIVTLLSCQKPVDENKIASDAVEAYKEKQMVETDKMKTIAQQFYNQLSNPNDPQTDALSKNYMDENWVSTPKPISGAGRVGFVKTLSIFGAMIPDLKWEPQEMLVSGNRIIVRSIATGTPNSEEGRFFGTPTNGTKKFEIPTIDIHTIENGKITESHHVEAWLTALGQINEQSK